MVSTTTTNGEQKNNRRKVGLKGGESTPYPGETLLVPIVSTVSSNHFISDSGWWWWYYVRTCLLSSKQRCDLCCEDGFLRLGGLQLKAMILGVY